MIQKLLNHLAKIFFCSYAFWGLVVANGKKHQLLLIQPLVAWNLAAFSAFCTFNR
jgi:hypothetical protein